MRGDDQLGAVVDEDLRAAGHKALEMARVRRTVLPALAIDLRAMGRAQRSGDVVLCRERVGRTEANLGPGRQQGANEVRRLCGDVQADGHSQAGERTLTFEALAYRP